MTNKTQTAVKNMAIKRKLENKRFITAVCVLFLIKTRWPNKKSIYEVVCCGFLLDGKILCLEPKHTFQEFEMERNKHQEDSANV